MQTPTTLNTFVLTAILTVLWLMVSIKLHMVVMEKVKKILGDDWFVSLVVATWALFPCFGPSAVFFGYVYEVLELWPINGTSWFWVLWIGSLAVYVPLFRWFERYSFTIAYFITPVIWFTHGGLLWLVFKR